MSPFRTIVLLATPGVSVFGLGLVGKVFAARPGLPEFTLTICAKRPGDLVTDLGLPMRVEAGLDALREADLLLLLPADTSTEPPSAELVRAVTAAHASGSLVAAFCSGTFLLAATGLLDGLRATTHWSLADELAARHPLVTVLPDTLYADEGSIVTGAGAAAGLDLCLHLLRREYGTAVANAVAREVVVAPHRDGDRAQYIPGLVPSDDGSGGERVGEAMEWALRHLDRPLAVQDLAERALMSRRTFARRFSETIGTTPHAWIRARRLDRAEELLETTSLPVEQVARLAGFGSVSVLRELFARRRRLSPSAYRREFTPLRPDGPVK